MEDNLVGYLLGALDPETHTQLEAHLREHPEAHAQLELLRRALAPLALDVDTIDPPEGLALRTLARVAEHRCSSLPAAPRVPAMHVSSAPRRWGARRADWLVAALLLVLVGGLFGAWTVQQWRQYHVNACQDNLRVFYTGLRAHADQREGAFPCVEEGEGPRSAAGIFVPVLNDARMLDGQASVGCPARGRRAPTSHTVAELERMCQESAERFRTVAHDLAGDYAYTLGYREGGRVHGLRQDSGDQIPLLADAPPPVGMGNSLNHGERGQNVLHVGGHVGWHPSRRLADDDIYLNRENRVAPGLDRHDAVLGASGTLSGGR